MELIEAVKGSFRDPSGHVYMTDGRIFRTVMEKAAAHFEFVDSTGLMQKLERDGLVLPYEKVDKEALGPLAEGAKYILEVPKLPFVSYPYEWPFSALKAAALLHLEIHLAALERGVTLSDSTAYNVQFRGARPVFIDHLSFRWYEPGAIWMGHRQFCEQFVTPLLLRALFGIGHNAWNRGAFEGIPVIEFRRLLKWRHYLNRGILAHIVMHSWLQQTRLESSLAAERTGSSGGHLPLKAFTRMLQNLHQWISRLEPADVGKTVWQDYEKTNSYGEQEANAKKRFVKDFIHHKRPQQMWDLGCNTGEYAAVALEAGASYVVGFDFDQAALEACFARAAKNKLALQTLCMDAASPSPSQGWMEVERQGLQSRASADAILSLALVHHLVISRNIPFGQLIDWIVGLAPAGIIEFVPKSDPMVQRLLCLREDIFPDYTLDFFIERIAKKADIVKTMAVSPTSRVLLWYQRS